MKTYKCKCGKEFTDSYKFGGHKSICRIYLGEEKYNKIIEIRKQNAINTNKLLSERNKKKKAEDLQQWINEKHRCETCGKIMTVKLRKGRFCSKSCAAAHGRVKKPKRLNGIFKCSFCKETFMNKGSLMNHIYNKHPEFGNKEDQLIKIPGKIYKDQGTLDITLKELEEYRKTHLRCEICGKSLEQIKEKSKQSRGLCIDHDHVTNKFRGLLCTGCNRHLGWYDKFKTEVDNYLSKN